ncbi:MAG: PAS domain-containing protein [Snowella sp.]|nr:PAS domain-containing protein [Snowella sp.]
MLFFLLSLITQQVYYLFKEEITARLLCRCVETTLKALELSQKLRRLQERDAILAQIMLQISQLLSLEAIYETVTTQLRDFLGADRVLIYQFSPDFSGSIVAEAVIPPWQPCLHEQIVDTYFQESLGEAYQQGRVFAAGDIYQADLSDCHLALLERFQVRANLVVPILLPTSTDSTPLLWGLLVVHQCSGPHFWEDDDIYFVERLATKLAIAIKQYLSDQQLKTQLAELSDSENRFRQLAENIHQVFYLADVETSAILYISPSYETIWERDRQSLYDNPLSYQETIYSEDLEIGRQSYQESRLGKAIENEYRIVRPDGSLRWISDRNFPIRNQSGEIYRVCGIAEDITNRKQTELQLAASEAQFQKLAATLPGMLYTLVRKVDGSFVFTYISPIIAEIMELEAEAAIANANLVFEQMHPDDVPDYIAAVEQNLITMQPFEHEWRIITPSGKTKWLKASSRPEKMPNQEVHWSGICLEITEQKEAQIQLSKTEKLFREAQRIARLGNWELDLRENYLYWSEEVFRIFEINSQQFMPSYEGFLEKVHPDDRELVNDAYSRHLHDQIPYRITHRLLMANGRIKYVQEQCETVFAEDGTPLVSQGTVQDITEIKEVELLLQNLNQSLELTITERTRELQEINILQQTILDSTELAIISTDPEGLIKTFNRGAEKMLGYSAEEIIGKQTPDLFLDPEDLQNIAKNLSAELGVEVEGNVRDINLKTQPVIKEKELTYIRKDGSRFPICLSVNPLKNNQQQIIGFLGINRDITLQKESDRQRKKAEESLRRSESRFRSMFDSNVVGMLFADFQGHIIDANDYFLKIIGYTREELESNKIDWLAMTPAEHLAKDFMCMEQLKKYGEISPWEKEYFHKEGHRIAILIGAAYLTESQDETICVVIDISDRKQREQENRILKERLEFVLSANPAVIFTCKPGEDFGATFVSDNIYNITGYTTSEFLSQSSFWADHLHPEDAPQVFANLNNLFKQGHHIHEYRFRHRDGHYLWVNNELSLVQDEQGNPIEIVGYFADISDRKHHELELRKAYDELARLLKLREETLRLREDMSNMIVHDLRNPLTSILLAAEVMLKYVNRIDAHSILFKKAEQILTSGQRMKTMIDSLLLMAKLESGKILFNPVATDLSTLGKSILTEFELTARAHKIQLKGELPQPGNTILIDAIILRRIIENLISNALKFSPPNSRIILSLEYLPENHIRVKVIDNGPGITPAEAEKIFQKFEIGTVKQNTAQIGLGLAFCKMAVEAQGGTLTLLPNQPQGSIFTVEI